MDFVIISWKNNHSVLINKWPTNLIDKQVQKPVLNWFLNSISLESKIGISDVAQNSPVKFFQSFIYLVVVRGSIYYRQPTDETDPAQVQHIEELVRERTEGRHDPTHRKVPLLTLRHRYIILLHMYPILYRWYVPLFTKTLDTSVRNNNVFYFSTFIMLHYENILILVHL